MGFWEFVAKTTATIATGIVLGPAAIPVGAAVWATNKVVKETCDDEDVKKIFGTLGDIGGNAALGAVTDITINELYGQAYTCIEVRADIEKHLYHKAQGINYQRDCKVCTA
ncbi:17409_t:CDS:2 [Dentiscutata erythropus]|uniref:17409_t:CDS:1 n=1 Tax=Dentiscutata erythropus TaxID=1348616 RepID=A0A9N8YU60_9GLOM|nr:17409_t:CDS:2 [Dentiscutata erythropus]